MPTATKESWRAAVGLERANKAAEAPRGQDLRFLATTKPFEGIEGLGREAKSERVGLAGLEV